MCWAWREGDPVDVTGARPWPPRDEVTHNVYRARCETTVSHSHPLLLLCTARNAVRSVRWSRASRFCRTIGAAREGCDRPYALGHGLAPLRRAGSHPLGAASRRGADGGGGVEAHVRVIP